MAETKKTSRRNVLKIAGALGATGLAVGSIKTAKAGNAGCLVAPDCNTICEFGGTPKSDGTQECICNPNPGYDYEKVCYSGAYSDLKDLPFRAGSPSDGGPATNATSWNSYKVRLNETEASENLRIPVIDGDYIDYAFKSEIGSVPNIGAKKFTVSKSGYSFSISRDQYGRLIGCDASYDKNAVNCINCKDCKNCDCCDCTDCTNCCNCCNCSNCRCDCDCCDCGDDSGCFISGELLTKEGFKEISAIEVGDILLGDDGEHKVLGIATNVLGKTRFAVTPADDNTIVLTCDHIIVDETGPIAYSKKYLYLNHITLKSDTVEGTYFYPGLFEECAIRPLSFHKREMSEKTKTYSFIVDKGRLGKTRGGTSVLLAGVKKGADNA